MYAIKKTEIIPVCGSDKLEAVSYLTEGIGNFFNSLPFISGNDNIKIKWFLSRGEALDYMEEYIFPEYREGHYTEVFFEIVDFIYITIAEEATL